jgi:DNA-binding MarR family transcriptional regulator
VTSQERLAATFEDFLGRCMASTEIREVDRLLDLDLSMSQTKSIFVLSQAAEPLPITALSSRLGLSAATAGRTVDQLVRSGLAERAEDPADRRVKLVSITTAGREIAEQHYEAHRATFVDLFARLSDVEADRLHDALQPLLAAVDQTTHAQEIPV